MHPAQCPLPTDLRRFVIEGHTEHEDWLASHLDRCDSCRNAIDEMLQESGPPRLLKLDTPPARTPIDASQPSAVGLYRIEREIGRGSFGTVYQARHRVTKQYVALKVFHGFDTDPLVARKLKREAEVAGAVDHPNVVRILEAGSADGRHYCAFEWLSGGDLRQHVSCTLETFRSIAEIACSIARGARRSNGTLMNYREPSRWAPRHRPTS